MTGVTDYLTKTLDKISLKESAQISVYPANFFVSSVCWHFTDARLLSNSIIMHPHTPGATYQWEAHSKKSTIQTPHNTNSAHSFLRSRKSSKSV